MHDLGEPCALVPRYVVLIYYKPPKVLPVDIAPMVFTLNQIHLLSLRGLISPPPQPTLLYICIAKGWVSVFYGLSLMTTALANS